MREFIQGWRRKTGLALLAFALLLSAAWCESLFTTDSIRVYSSGRLHAFQSSLGKLGWAAGPEDSCHRDQKSMYGYYYWHKDFVMLQDSFWECRSHKDFIVFETGCHMMKPLKYLDSKSLSIRFNWWRVPYWAVILPLTLLSAFLIISKPRQPKAPRALQT